MTYDLRMQPMPGRYAPTAVYFLDSDCVEYVTEDAFCIYERIDDFLTLVLDETKYNAIGFKLKGFKHVFETYLKPTRSELSDQEFVDLVPAIETAFKKLGDRMFSVEAEERVRAYKAARKIATGVRVRMPSFAGAVAQRSMAEGGHHRVGA
jgi:hypothetical protein